MRVPAYSADNGVFSRTWITVSGPDTILLRYSLQRGYDSFIYCR